MPDNEPSDGGGHGCSARAIVRLAVGAAAGCLLAAGCAFEKHYDFWSIFIDGIPNPSLLPAGSGSEADAVSLRLSPTYTAHKPYVEERCDECHSDRFASFTNVGADVCIRCHSDVPDEYPNMHGPVVVQACLWCHFPHESRHRWLLKAEPRQVCSQCHQPDMLSTDRVPAHADETASCLDCHSGHGGHDRYFLTDVRPAPAVPAEGR